MKRTPNRKAESAPRRDGTRVGPGGVVLKLQGHQELSVRGRECGRVKKDGTGGSVSSGDSVEEANEAHRGSAGGQGRVATMKGQAAAAQNRVRKGTAQGPGAPCFLIDVGSQRQAFHQGSS